MKKSQGIGGPWPCELWNLSSVEVLKKKTKKNQGYSRKTSHSRGSFIATKLHCIYKLHIRLFSYFTFVTTTQESCSTFANAMGDNGEVPNAKYEQDRWKRESKMYGRERLETGDWCTREMELNSSISSIKGEFLNSSVENFWTL